MANEKNKRIYKEALTEAQKEYQKTPKEKRSRKLWNATLSKHLKRLHNKRTTGTTGTTKKTKTVKQKKNKFFDLSNLWD